MGGLMWEERGSVTFIIYVAISAIFVVMSIVKKCQIWLNFLVLNGADGHSWMKGPDFNCCGDQVLHIVVVAQISWPFIHFFTVTEVFLIDCYVWKNPWFPQCWVHLYKETASKSTCTILLQLFKIGSNSTLTWTRGSSDLIFSNFLGCLSSKSLVKVCKSRLF